MSSWYIYGLGFQVPGTYLQLGLNFAWTPLMFLKQDLKLALVDITGEGPPSRPTDTAVGNPCTHLCRLNRMC